MSLKVMCGVGAFALLVVTEAGAEDSQAGSRESQVIEEITVTAQKMGAQSILTVPLTISALNSQTLEAAGVQGLADIGHLSPSVNFVESLGRSFNYLSMRGVSSTEGGTPTVQVYVDGFTTGIARSQLNTTLFDLERVEILEGPQATLYGRNAIGGLINYITQKPGDDLKAELRATGAQYGTADVMGRVAGPLVPHTLFGEISVSHHQRDGYVDNTFNGQDGVDSQRDNSARAALRAVLGNTTIDLSGTYSKLRDGCGDCSYVPRDYNIPLLAGLPPYDTSLRDGRVNLNSYDRTINQDTPTFLDVNSGGAVLNIEHDFGWSTLTSISGYGKVDTDTAFSLNRAAGRNPNFAYNSYVLTDFHDKSWSEELRLSGGSETTLRWLIGGYYSRITQNGLTYLGFLLPNPVAEDHYSSINSAVFANAELPIGTRFVLGGGLRYDKETVDDHNPLFFLSGSAGTHEVLPRVTASYHFDSGLMPYATVSKGYKSGGVNVSSPDPTVPRTFAPEFLWNYEAGLKGRLFDSRGIFTLSAFRMNWNDRQVQLLDPSGVFVYQANLGKAHINGVEAQVNFNLDAHFQVDAGVTYLDGVIDRYVDASGVSTFYGVNPDLAGNRLPNAPRFRGTLSPQWSTPVFGNFQLRARADISYTGARDFDAQNLLRQDAYTLVNLNVGLISDHYEFSVFANNLFDVGYHSAGTLSAGVGPLLTTGAPRVVGARISLKL